MRLSGTGTHTENDCMAEINGESGRRFLSALSQTQTVDDWQQL